MSTSIQLEVRYAVVFTSDDHEVSDVWELDSSEVRRLAQETISTTPNMVLKDASVWAAQDTDNNSDNLIEFPSDGQVGDLETEVEDSLGIQARRVWQGVRTNHRELKRFAISAAVAIVEEREVNVTSITRRLVDTDPDLTPNRNSINRYIGGALALLRAGISTEELGRAASARNFHIVRKCVSKRYQLKVSYDALLCLLKDPSVQQEKVNTKIALCEGQSR
jgi:hypothetical protein